MNSLLRIFVVLALLNISVNAETCDVILEETPEGYELKIDNLCKCMGFDKPVSKGAGAGDPTMVAENTVELEMNNETIFIENAKDTCLKAGFSKDEPAIASSPTGPGGPPVPENKTP